MNSQPSTCTVYTHTHTHLQSYDSTWRWNHTLHKTCAACVVFSDNGEVEDGGYWQTEEGKTMKAETLQFFDWVGGKTHFSPETVLTKNYDANRNDPTLTYFGLVNLFNKQSSLLKKLLFIRIKHLGRFALHSTPNWIFYLLISWVQHAWGKAHCRRTANQGGYH